MTDRATFPMFVTDEVGTVHAWTTANNLTVCGLAADGMPIIVGGKPTCETCLLPHIICPRCGMVSFNAKDIEHGYCGNCRAWTSDPIGRSNQ